MNPNELHQQFFLLIAKVILDLHSKLSCVALQTNFIGLPCSCVVFIAVSALNIRFKFQSLTNQPAWRPISWTLSLELQPATNTNFLYDFAQTNIYAVMHKIVVVPRPGGSEFVLVIWHCLNFENIYHTGFGFGFPTRYLNSEPEVCLMLLEDCVWTK